VTARSAADVLEISPKTGAFYKKVRQVITHHLQHESADLFEGCVELDERCLGGKRKGKRGRGAAERGFSLGSSSVMARSARRWSTTPGPSLDTHCFRQNQA